MAAELHYFCDTPAVFGFDRGPIAAFRACRFLRARLDMGGCPPLRNSTLCIDKDVTYHAMPNARRYQMMGLYDIASHGAIKHVWGHTAQVADTSVGSVTIARGRALTAAELSELPVAFRPFLSRPACAQWLISGLGLSSAFRAASAETPSSCVPEGTPHLHLRIIQDDHSGDCGDRPAQATLI